MSSADVSRSSETAVRREYGRLASSYDRRWSRYIAESVRETLRRAKLQPGERVLDVGCGTGELLREVVPAESGGGAAAGVDLSMAMLLRARQKVGASAGLIAADAQRLPFRDRAFDVVVSTSALHYWPDPGAALREIARVLGPAGRIVITDWCDDYLICRVCDRVLRVVDRAHQRAYGSRGLRGLLEQAGYERVDVVRYKVGWLWGLMTATAELAKAAG